MNIIESIGLKSLRNSEFIQFGTDIISIVDLNDASTLQVQTQRDTFMNAKNAAELLFKRDMASIITDELIGLDNLRYSLINGIIALVQGYTYSTDEPTRTQALLLQNSINAYGSGIARENYQSETAILSNLATDWTNDQALADVLSSLNLTGWKDQMVAANQQFNVKYLARTQEIGAAPTDSLRAKRAEVASAYYVLRSHIEAYYTINDGAEPFKKTVNELNALIAQYNKLIGGRKSGDAGDAPTEPEA